MAAVPGTIDELIAGIEVEFEAAQKRKTKTKMEVQSILALAGQEGRSNLTPEEDDRVAKLFVARDQAQSDMDGIKVKLGNANKIKAENDIDAGKAREVQSSGARKPAYDEVTRVGMEERTYHKGVDRKGAGFLRDVLHQHLFADVAASTRLARHMAEERVERAQYLERAVGTGAFTGLVVPQYLTDMYAPAVAALRPFADICNHHDLPSQGMTVNISRITTPSSVAIQSTENTAVSATDMDDTLLTENILTAAGQQTISRQASERGTGIEEIVMDDLFRRYATALDASLLNTATTGLAAVAQAVTYDDASPSGPEVWPKILQGAANSEAALLGFAKPDVVLMHSRRWYWMQAQLVNQWPLFGQPGLAPQTGGANYATEYGRGARGVLPNGMIAVVDNNVTTALGTGTNQDEIYVVASDECHLWEDPAAPVFIRCEQPAVATLGILMVLYGYYAFSMRRYSNAMSRITGSGLVTPTF
jgi:hypothetical protein